MEDLTKHQLILLVLLVTFVTSIGTGIITFTLLSEAPVEVTQTINRVVETTIEKVVPETGEPQKVVTTVVVNEEDRVLDAISKNEKSIVRLKTLSSDGTYRVSGIGLVVSSNGVVVSDLRSYNSNLSYSVVFYDGKVYPTGKVFVDNQNGLVFMQTMIPKNDNSKQTFYPGVLGDSDSLKIGQTLVAISGYDTNAVSIGRIRQLDFASNNKDKVTKIVSDITAVKTNIGSPVLNLSGEVVGIEAPISESDSVYSYMPINAVKTSLSEALKSFSK